MSREIPHAPDKAVADRLRQVRRYLGKTAAEMAAAVEVSRGYWSELENAKSAPGPKLLSALERVFLISTPWLLRKEGHAFLSPPHGARASQLVDKSDSSAHLQVGSEGPPQKLTNQEIDRSAHLPHAPEGADIGSSYTRRAGGGVVVAGVSERPVPASNLAASALVRFGGALTLPPVFEVIERQREYVVIPSIEASARAGTGSADMQAEQERIAACVAGVMAMDRSWMVQQLGREDGGFATIQVMGNSMLPTLHDGDTIIIDTLVNRVDTDGIYVLRRGAQMIVKRIKVLMDESAIVSGDNEAYGPGEQLQPASVRELRVVGRMVWPRLR